MCRLSWPTIPEIDEMFTMDPPPPCRMAGTACFMPRKTPLALMLMRVSQCVVLRVSRSYEPLIPALFTRMSTRPYAPTVVLTASCQSSSLATSSLTNCALPPSALIFSATARPSASITSATTTMAPSRAKMTASLSPIPCAAPVTIATLPPSLMGILRAGVPSGPRGEIVRLIDEPDYPQAIVHTHGRRLAAPPVLHDVAHRAGIEGLRGLGGDDLLALGGDEAHGVVVIVDEDRVASPDLPLAVAPRVGHGVADLNHAQHAARRAQKDGGEVLHSLAEGVVAELRSRYRRLLTREMQEEVQHVRSEIAQAAAARLRGVEHPRRVPRRIARGRGAVEPEVKMRQGTEGAVGEQAPRAGHEGRIALGKGEGHEGVPRHRLVRDLAHLARVEPHGLLHHEGEAVIEEIVRGGRHPAVSPQGDHEVRLGAGEHLAVVREGRRSAELTRPLRGHRRVGIVQSHELHVGQTGEDAEVGGVVERVPVADLDGGDAHRATPCAQAPGRRPRARWPTRAGPSAPARGGEGVEPCCRTARRAARNRPRRQGPGLVASPPG